jgi:hypothetical protein
MTHVCCPSCRLRFTRAAASHLVACPGCGEPPQTILRAEQVMGFRVAPVDDLPDALLQAVAVALPVHDPGETRS